MSWKMFGKIAAGIAAPFTGGASLSAIPLLDAIGSGAGAAGESMTANRSNAANTEMAKYGLQQNQERNYFNTKLEKDAAQRSNAGDAFRRLQQVMYLSGDPIQGPGVAGPYSKPIKGASEEMREVAKNPAIRDALFNRATYQHDPLGGEMPSRTVDTTALDETAKSSFLEKLLGIVGAGTSAYSAASKPPVVMTGKK